jgi:hypothetical protein
MRFLIPKKNQKELLDTYNQLITQVNGNWLNHSHDFIFISWLAEITENEQFEPTSTIQ